MLGIGEGKSGYEPWPSFLKAHLSPAQFVLCSGAERVGKSIATAMEGIAWLPLSQLIWICGPQYRDTLREFWIIAEAMLNMGITTKGRIKAHDKQPSKMTTKDGRVVETRTLWEMERSLVAEAPDLILVVEAGLIDRDPIDKLRLRTSTRRGRVWLSGTLESNDWFRHAYERWQIPNDELGESFSVPLYENQQDFPGGPENPEIVTMRLTMRPAVFSERVEGKPAASEQLVFVNTFVQGNKAFCMKPVKFTKRDVLNKDIPVDIAIDPGHFPSAYSVSFIQEFGNEIHVVDEVVCYRMSHEAVIRKCESRPAWANVVGGTIDPWAGRQHGMGYQYTPQEIWKQETGIELRIPSKAPTPPEIIDRYGYYLNNPMTKECRLFFHPDVTPHLAKEWRSWRYPRDGRGGLLRMEPSKKNCDSIKGVGYWLVDKFNSQSFDRRSKFAPRVTVRDWRFV